MPNWFMQKKPENPPHCHVPLNSRVIFVMRGLTMSLKARGLARTGVLPSLAGGEAGGYA
jgi:hypothetical protein